MRKGEIGRLSAGRFGSAFAPAILCLLLAARAWAAPSVTLVSPVDGSRPPGTTNVTATFSESMDPATINPDSFVVTRDVGSPRGIAAGEETTFAVRGDGTVTAWGTPAWGATAVPAGLSGVKEVVAYFYNGAAIKDDNSIVMWGRNLYGNCNVPPGLPAVRSVAIGLDFTLVALVDGTVTGWGSNADGQLTIPAGLGGVVKVAGGGKHAVALQDNGTVVAWGFNAYGECDVPPGLDAVDIAAGEYFTMALRRDGTVVAWGSNAYGRCDVPAGLSGVIDIACSSYHVVALKSDGTVVAWGYNGEGQTNVPSGLFDVAAIAAGDGHSVALTDNGAIVMWGLNRWGQCTTPAYPSPYESAIPGTVSYDDPSRTATLTPAAALVAGVTYHPTVTSAVMSALGEPIPSLVRWSFTPAAPLSILTSSPLPTARRNQSYSTTLTTTGGVPPYAWALSSGALPPGLTISSAGVISGKATTNGTYTFWIAVSDQNSTVAYKQFSVTVQQQQIH